ncbi:exocyst complex component EXO70A3-like [Trifolium pratense]|uniref:exocyst complex component EXO70A3-like n=1 Tax=Trifolium pratense TaxID=57577 RepID=UPI001E697201|nr:exocyst complex component EXO70A3-like [Trifolium pratense]
MKGKPDAYSLLSCAAFAIMSLSLSRETQSGFKIDLIYFFLGSLILQLMKIKLLLCIPGVGFGYLIFILRSHFSSINDAIQAESHSQQLVSTIDNDDPTSLQDENLNVIVDPHSTQLPSTSTADIGGSMLEKISDCVKALRRENSTLMEMLMEKLKDYLSDDSGFNVSDPDFMIMALSTETIDNLHKTAKLMVRAGLKCELSDVYTSSRREYLVESLSRLGFKKLSIEDLQMLSWKEIEDEIKRWIKASNVALKILLPAEHKLFDQVFFGFSSTADLSFMDVCRESTLQLLDSADTIAIGSRSPERLFRVLDMFETMRDLIIPEFESLFPYQYSGSLQIEAMATCKRLGEAIRGIFIEFGNQISQDSTEEIYQKDELPSITSYVMDHLCAASRSRKTLEQVFDGDYGDPLKEYPKIEDRVHSCSDLSVQMGLIMKLLWNKLAAIAKYHENVLIYNKLPLWHSGFLMTNRKYIAQKAEDSELGAILGDNWFINNLPGLFPSHPIDLNELADINVFLPGVGFGYLIILCSHFSSINDAIQAESHSPQLLSTTDNGYLTSLQDQNLNVIVDQHSPQLAITYIGSSILKKTSDYVKALRQANSTLFEMLMEKLKDYPSDDSGLVDLMCLTPTS